MSVLRKCPDCGAKNRWPAKRLANSGQCGSCKATLPPMDTPIDADMALFDEVLAESPAPVLVDFWASWCGPCRMAAPEVEAVAKEMAGQAVVLKVNTEKHRELAARYRIQSIPTFLVLSNGKVVMEHSGLSRRAEMRRWLESAGVSAA